MADHETIARAFLTGRDPLGLVPLWESGLRLFVYAARRRKAGRRACYPQDVIEELGAKLDALAARQPKKTPPA